MSFFQYFPFFTYRENGYCSARIIREVDCGINCRAISSLHRENITYEPNPEKMQTNCILSISIFLYIFRL